MSNENQRVDVLDHGYARLVESMGDDMSVVRSARVSYNAKPRKDGSDEKLLRYLYKNRHTSPFEAVEFQFEIKCPMFIARQWHRHRTWAYNEVSARYTALPEEFYVPEAALIDVQNKNNKQQRDIVPLEGAETYRQLMRTQNEEAFQTYKILLQEGVPRELARTVLPVSTYTHYFAKVDLHNLLHFLRLRLHPHAQLEIQVYAEALLELIRPIVPVTVSIFEEQLERDKTDREIISVVRAAMENVDDDTSGYLMDDLERILECP